jgi:hypothetical protein
MIISEKRFVAFCDDFNGYCSSCDEVTQYGEVEPDAFSRTCLDCSKPHMMGVESALVMGFIEIGGGL